MECFRRWNHFQKDWQQRNGDVRRFRSYTWHCKGIACRLKPSNIILTIAAIAILLYFFSKRPKVYRYPENILGPWSLENDTWTLDPNQTCIIPRLNPFDKTILPHLAAPTEVQCYQRFPWMSYVDYDGRLRLNESAVKQAGYYGINDTSLFCEYAAIQRVVGDDSATVFGPTLRLMPEGNILDCDFVRVLCRNFLGFFFYENFHVNIWPVKANQLQHVISEEVQCPENQDQKVETSKEKDAINLQKNTSDPKFSASKRPNVIVLGFDSMSRSNFVRQLPLSRHYFLHELGAVELRGYNKIGDNTYPNIVPMLTGLHHRSSKLPPAEFTDDTREDLRDDLIFNAKSERTYKGDATYPYHDAWPFIWKEYEKQGYVTLFSEDMPGLGLFNYAGQGFYKAPTRHYMRPFWLSAHASMLHSVSKYLCLGATPTHEITLDYLYRFATTYASHGIPYFAFMFLTEISHDYPNQAGVMDAIFENWFTRLYHSGALNNTVMILMSDHGYRYGTIRRTSVGRLEDYMPFCAVRMPPDFISKYPQIHSNIATNAFRLSTSYDIHETLVQILRLGNLCTDADIQADGGARKSVGGYGTSLLTPLSRSRTCKSAGIPPQYCICGQEEDIQIKDSRSKFAAEALVFKLNILTAPYRTHCSVLSLSTVVEAQLIKGNDNDNQKTLNSTNAQSTVRVTIVTLPGEGIFEGLVHVDLQSSISEVEVMDDISRVNVFGKQADCLSKAILRSNDDLKKYCYCR